MQPNEVASGDGLRVGGVGHQVKYFRGAWKYRLSHPVNWETGIESDGFKLRFCSITAGGRLSIHAGYSWDGASWFPDFRWILRGSCVHDSLYQLLRETGFGEAEAHDVRRQQADEVFRLVCLDAGAWGWQARLVHDGVRLGGGPAARIKPRRIYLAP